MPDTGAPWNIPYVAGTDLVSDWPTDSQTLAEAIADGLDNAGNAGIGTNVVQAAKTDSFSTTSASFVDVTGLSVTITPSSATAKVLVIAQVNVNMVISTTTGATAVTISGGNISSFEGPDGIMSYSGHYDTRHDTEYTVDNVTPVYLDSPATTSPVTYQVQIKKDFGTGTSYVNSFDTSSSIVAIEVAA